MLTAADIAALRALQVQAMPDSCAILRAIETPDGAGGQQTDWATVATTPCRLSRLGRSGEERLIAERLTAVTPLLVALPAGTDVRPTDRLSIGGRTFEVAAVLATGAWETARRVACVEVQ